MSLAHLNPDKTLAEGFLTLLDAETDSFTFQTFDGNKVRRKQNGGRDPLADWKHGTLDEHWSWLVDFNRRGAGVFVMVQAGDGTGRNNAAVHTIRAIFQEDDGDGRDLPLEPHVVVESSPSKYHRYLLVEGLELEDFDAVMPRMIADYGSDPNAKDRARVLRLPGFYHVKVDTDHPLNPHLVRVVHESGAQAYGRDEILRAFPPIISTRTQRTAEAPATGDLPPVDTQTLRELASALSALPVPDEYGPWIEVSLALASLKRHGQDREAKRLWVSYSMRSTRWEDTDLAKWEGFKPSPLPTNRRMA